MKATITWHDLTETVDVTDGSDAAARLDALRVRSGRPFDAACCGVTFHAETPAAPVYSTWGDLHVDDAAKARIDALNADITARTGIDPKAFFESGTRMGKDGYDTMDARRAEYDSETPVADKLAAMVDRVRAERRHQIVLPSHDIASKLTMNGVLRFDGYKLSRHALRGLVQRIGSPVWAYLIGLRDRIAADVATIAKLDGSGTLSRDDTAKRAALVARVATDKARLLTDLQYETATCDDIPVSFRARSGLGDIFATTSPNYGVADLPDTAPDVLAALPHGVKGSVSYDPESTRWEIRARVFTPTPSDQMAVKEPFEGGASLRGIDNATGKLGGGGYLLFIQCLNASIWRGQTAEIDRVHRANVLRDFALLVRKSTDAIRVLVEAWAASTTAVVEPPALVPVEDVIPGFYRAMLTARRGELVGVLPGRTETHVKALPLVYASERADRGKHPGDPITRADLANGVTRYVQRFPLPVQNATSAAVGAWLVRAPRLEHAAA